LRQLLEAKRKRVRQGPTWPAANAHTGIPGSGTNGMSDAEAPGSATQTFSPEANRGIVGMHGRGNQGKRGQK
jgi:hypothetical protein